MKRENGLLYSDIFPPFYRINLPLTEVVFLEKKMRTLLFREKSASLIFSGATLCSYLRPDGKGVKFEITSADLVPCVDLYSPDDLR